MVFRGILSSFVVCCLALQTPYPAWGDETQAIDDGQTALTAGEFDRALEILSKAAGDYPQSVPVRLVLADCHLKMGNSEDALGVFRAILGLSPDHPYARRMVDALQTHQASTEKLMTAAEALIEIGAYASADSVLSELLKRAISSDERDRVRLVRLEARLWNGKFGSISSDAVRLASEASQPAIVAQARVIAALARCLNQKDELTTQLLDAARNLEAPWSARAAAARITMQMANRQNEVQVATIGQLRDVIDAIRPGPYRDAMIKTAMDATLNSAGRFAGRAQYDEARALLWALASGQAVPGAESTGQALQISGGLITPDNSAQLNALVTAIADLGVERFRSPDEAEGLATLWSAAELSRQLRPDKLLTASTVGLIERLAKLTNDTAGDVATAAEQLESKLLLRFIESGTYEPGRMQAAKLISAQLDRMRDRGALAAALAQFVTLTTDEPFTVELRDAIEQMPRGAARAELLAALARGYITVAQQADSKQSNRPVGAAVSALSSEARAALTLAGRLAAEFPKDPRAMPIVAEIVEQYAVRENWSLAAEATDVAFGDAPSTPGRWFRLRLQLRQMQVVEDRRLAARLPLDKELGEPVRRALEDIVQLVKQGTAQDRSSATGLLRPVVHRYAAIFRSDLAEAVIATIADAGVLEDWSLWMRAELVEAEAAYALFLEAGRFGQRQSVELLPSHQRYLALLSQLIKEHPDSEYAALVVGKISETSALYGKYGAFDAAARVLDSFLEATPSLAAAEQIEYQRLQVQLEKARDQFANRSPESRRPTAIEPADQEVIAAIVEFLKRRTTGDYASMAQNEIIQIARRYGEADAWPVARDVLASFDGVEVLRVPERLEMLKAATYLGELDPAYGLEHLALFVESRSSTSSAASLSGPIAAGEKYENAKKPLDALLPLMDSFQDESRLTGGLSELAARETPGDSGAGGGGGGFGGYAYGRAGSGNRPMTPPNETALAMIRQAQQRQFQQLAMLEQAGQQSAEKEAQDAPAQGQQQAAAVALPSGRVLSEAEQQRQDDASDRAYEILIHLADKSGPAVRPLAQKARQHILWLFGFFEGQNRPDRAIVLVARFLTDQPDDPAKVALAFQSLNDRVAVATQRDPQDRQDLAWLDARHQLFDLARQEIRQFIASFSDEKTWVQNARLLESESFRREAEMVAAISAVRAAGLLVQSADLLVQLINSPNEHAQVSGVPERLWAIADQLTAWQQTDQAIYVLNQIPIRFPTNALAPQAVLRIAESHASNLSNPLQAVETFLEYLSLNGDDQPVRDRIFATAQQLSALQRYLESLHIYAVFVDTFPDDARAAEALHAMGMMHQQNRAWQEAMNVYERILDEYSSVALIPQIKLQMAKCEINMSHWREARRIYEQFITAYPKDGQAAMAQSRLLILKNLERFQTLLADEDVDRNKDDAQFQIGRIVLSQLANPVKAVEEFRKVVRDYPASDVADDAQLEIGRTLMALDRLDSGRAALREVAARYPNSPLADDAMFLIGESYEKQALTLAAVTLEKARADAFTRNQRDAYQSFSKKLAAEDQRQQIRRGQLKQAGMDAAVDLDEATNAARLNSFVFGNISNTARQAELQAEKESALQVASRQDQINEAYREAVAAYSQTATDYPLGDKTDDSLLRVAQIFETQLRDRVAAMETYERIVKFFPGTPVAEDAAWKVAVFHEQEGEYTLAVSSYREFIRNYPASGRSADAQFAMAEALEQLGKWVDAMDAYEIFRQKFGAHPKAQLATEQINWIKTYRK